MTALIAASAVFLLVLAAYAWHGRRRVTGRFRRSAYDLENHTITEYSCQWRAGHFVKLTREHWHF